MQYRLSRLMFFTERIHGTPSISLSLSTDFHPLISNHPRFYLRPQILPVDPLGKQGRISKLIPVQRHETSLLRCLDLVAPSLPQVLGIGLDDILQFGLSANSPLDRFDKLVGVAHGVIKALATVL